VLLLADAEGGCGVSRMIARARGLYRDDVACSVETKADVTSSIAAFTLFEVGPKLISSSTGAICSWSHCFI
jgi:hypothetical protein